MRLHHQICQFAEQRNSVRFLQRAICLALGWAIAVPCAVSAQECVYVLNQLDNSVVAVRRGTSLPFGKLSMPTDDCSEPPCHPMPTALEVKADASRAYVTRQDVNLVYVLDPVGGTVVDTVTIDSGALPAAASAAAALAPNGATLYVANLATDSLSVIDTATNDLVDTVDVSAPGMRTRPRAVAVTPDSSTVFVGNSGTDTVTAIRASDRMILKTIAVGDGPAGIAVSPNGARVYVSNGNGGSVSVVDVASLTATGTITVGTSPRGVVFAPNGALAFVTNVLGNGAGMGTVSVIDVASGAVAGNPIAVGGAPVAISITSDGALAYAANLMGNSLSVIDTGNRGVSPVEGLVGPFDVAVAGACPTAPPSCTGDCNGDGTVVVNEMISGVNIALGNQPASVCPAFDRNASGQVEINELIAAVGNVLNGCTG